MKKKTIICISLVLLICALTLSLAACNKKGSTIVMTDVYKNTSSIGEYTSSALVTTLPSDLTVYTPSSEKNRDYGYISALDAFVVKNSNGYYNLVQCGKSEALIRTSNDSFGRDLAITAIRVRYGLIAVLLDGGSAGGTAEVYNAQGQVVLSRANFAKTSSATSIDDVLNILTSDIVAVAPTYDANVIAAAANGTINTSTTANYATLYRASTHTAQGRLKNEVQKVSALEGYDDYVVVQGGKSNSVYTERIVKVGKSSASSLAEITATSKGTFYDTAVGDDYYYEITYIGNGKFYVHEDWSVSSSETYTYLLNGTDDAKTYYFAQRRVYNAQDDTAEFITSNIILMNLTNGFNNSTARTGIAASSFLNDGYMYASYCLYINSDKEGEYDQYILDKDMNIVYSLTGNFGINYRAESSTKVNYLDLVMSFRDGKGIVPLLPSEMRLYDSNGNVIFKNSEKTVSAASYNDGMIVALSGNYYGAYDMSGNIVVDFKYDSISTFVGNYAIGTYTDKDGKLIADLIGKDGVVVSEMSDRSTPLGDIARVSTATTAAYIFKNGVYMYKIANTDKDTNSNYQYFFGIKNFNTDTSKNVIMSATATSGMVKGSTLFSPSSDASKIFVFGKYMNDDNTYIYRIA